MTQWTLVTGGAKGLGKAICMRLASCGHHVVVHYRHSEQEAQQIAQACERLGVRSGICQGDFSTPGSVKDFIDRYQVMFGETLAVVNNVGMFLQASASITPTDRWMELFQVNLHAPVAVMQGLLPSLRRNRGAIVNIGMAGVEHSYADVYCSAYTASKAALWQVTRSFAKELASAHVRVNMVSPGYLENSVVKPASLQSLPMGREATREEVAETVAFLLKDTTQYITGQNIEVAGAVRL